MNLQIKSKRTMKKRTIQSEKLFNHQELQNLTKKLDALETMEKIENKFKLSKIFRNRNFH
jgi:hypothetical protein